MIFRYCLLKKGTKVFLSENLILSNTPTMREKQKANQKIIVFERASRFSTRATETQQAPIAQANRNSASTTGK
jgi:hypothetical protein